jgi:hypothetical protein
MFASIKIWTYRLLPAAMYGVLRAVWCSAREKAEWIFAFALGLRFIVLGTKLPSVVLFFGLAPGDDLLCTAVLRELRKRGISSLLMISNYPEIFKGNDDATYVIAAGSEYDANSRITRFQRFAKVWRRSFRLLEYAPINSIDHSAPPSRHIIAELCAGTGIGDARAPPRRIPLLHVHDGRHHLMTYRMFRTIR